MFAPRDHEDARPSASAPRESLSALLAADRLSKSSQALKDVAVTAANCAVGSSAGLVHLSSIVGANRGGQRVLGPGPTARLNETRGSFPFSIFQPHAVAELCFLFSFPESQLYNLIPF